MVISKYEGLKQKYSLPLKFCSQLGRLSTYLLKLSHPTLFLNLPERIRVMTQHSGGGRVQNNSIILHISYFFSFSISQWMLSLSFCIALLLLNAIVLIRFESLNVQPFQSINIQDRIVSPTYNFILTKISTLRKHNRQNLAE